MLQVRVVREADKANTRIDKLPMRKMHKERGA